MRFIIKQSIIKDKLKKIEIRFYIKGKNLKKEKIN